MNRIEFLVEGDATGGYSASALGASIITQAEDLLGLRDAIKEAVQCHFEDDERPSAIVLRGATDEVI